MTRAEITEITAKTDSELFNKFVELEKKDGHVTLRSLFKVSGCQHQNEMTGPLDRMERKGRIQRAGRMFTKETGQTVNVFKTTLEAWADATKPVAANRIRTTKKQEQMHESIRISLTYHLLKAMPAMQKYKFSKQQCLAVVEQAWNN